MSDEFQINAQNLDKLVDGELSPSGRRELLSALEQTDDGWRKCALAFLESQAWGREFRHLVHEPDAPDAEPASLVKHDSPSPTHWLALAASLLVAFVLGWQLPRVGLILPGGVAPTMQTAVLDDNSVEALSDLPIEEQIVARDAEPLGHDVLTMWVQDKQGVRRAVGVPLVDAAAFDPQFGTQFQSAISDPIRRQIEAQGYQVNSRRRYAPIWLENGRPLVVPVEDTQIVPVSRTVY